MTKITETTPTGIPNSGEGAADTTLSTTTTEPRAQDARVTTGEGTSVAESSGTPVSGHHKVPSNGSRVTGATSPSGMPRRPAHAAITNPKADIEALDNLEHHLYAHRYARIGLECYGPSIDPSAATADRGEALAILEEEDQALLSSPETEALLDRLFGLGHLLTKTQESQIRVLRRDRERYLGVPADLQANFARLVTKSSDVWRRAKATSDWYYFEPYLDRVVAAAKKIALARRPDADPYDTWLDSFEHGTDRVFYDDFFSQVKDCVVPLFATIRERGTQPSRAVVTGKFDKRRQWELANDLMKLEGLAPNRVLLVSAEHPYSDALTTNYAIIACHIHENDICSNVFTMLHEGGHALYELGVDPDYNYTSLKGGTSSGMHESQSRFFEDYVGRSRAFAGPLIRVMADHFKGQLGRVTPNQLHLATNRAVGTAVRTEADELTYPLHILIRYEIEQLLFSGECVARDVPRIWNARYKEYLGVNVHGDAQGALQDTHWASGLFGYFPTYAFGGAIGAQLRAQMITEGMDWNGVLSSGTLTPIHDWLRERIWRFGRSKDAGELIRDACKEPFSTQYYTDYLTEKFSALYGL